ncbi:hypothetical protein HJC23_013554 [Cyclotella cryptica]|uniref:Uncharacterized protein n=1 Tax=Cyclotella cryptica TaxID=29204 RepID=A0ABD3P7N8_9STRA|eukprot:CCRYP_017357-RA/>CCRYP_017357-RA protein AED:0.42 eAED:0.42 QI:324/1/1/1/1/1/3/201/187
MMDRITSVAFFGLLLLPHLVYTSIDNTALLRGKNSQVAGINKESRHRVMKFLNWWDCDFMTEEPCFDEYWNIISCAPYAEGGCPCPAGQERCGVTDTFLGYCASLCCDPKTQHSCWELTKNFTFDVTSCAALDVGCSCPEGLTYCGLNETPSEMCSPLCCNATTEAFCMVYDGSNYTTYCADLNEGC